MKGLAVALVLSIALVLAFAAGFKTADRRCVSAPVGPGGTPATWCGKDVPERTTSF